jgi:hypothetical protein
MKHTTESTKVNTSITKPVLKPNQIANPEQSALTIKKLIELRKVAESEQKRATLWLNYINSRILNMMREHAKNPNKVPDFVVTESFPDTRPPKGLVVAVADLVSDRGRLAANASSSANVKLK